ncbi:hypothetical protein CVT26_012568 [Gymnopilus dilepis]|uniref:Uncharacterized protein n=1 Tax=Gymnopilus dilepis TaxID=231916 RepID=A0A409WMW9_9AGAR|nr:hypothetical protein CVT26_012568 [Gymnopilus dilepis]
MASPDIKKESRSDREDQALVHQRLPYLYRSDAFSFAAFTDSLGSETVTDGKHGSIQSSEGRMRRFALVFALARVTSLHQGLPSGGLSRDIPPISPSARHSSLLRHVLSPLSATISYTTRQLVPWKKRRLQTDKPLDDYDNQDSSSALSSIESSGIPSRGQDHQPIQLPSVNNRKIGAKRALCIGINYDKTPGLLTLKGCIHDAYNMRNFLITEYQYKADDVVVLTDDVEGSDRLPTRDNILRHMRWLVQDAQPNDSLFLHYSGHGSQIKDENGDDIDGQDEVIIPASLLRISAIAQALISLFKMDYAESNNSYIVDDLMHKILVDPLPQDCRLTAVFDACHSGTVLDLPYVYSRKGKVKSKAFTLKGEKVVKPTRSSIANVICYSGCKDSETAADDQRGGAMTDAFMQSLQSNKGQTYRELLPGNKKAMYSHAYATPGDSHFDQTTTLFSSMSDDGPPFLPPELQRSIFEWVACTERPAITLKFMLLAKHVHGWLKPLLYQVFSQISAPRFPDFERYPGVLLEDVGPFARHLLIGGTEGVEGINRFISLCPNVYDLAVWTQHSFREILPALKHLKDLQRLSASLETLSKDDILSSPFAKLTHLDVVRFRGARWQEWELISEIKTLTHLAINTPVEVEVIQNLLKHGENLQLLLIMQESESNWISATRLIKDVAQVQDYRLVLIEVVRDIDVANDWEHGAQGDLDSWTFAEILSVARGNDFLLDNSQRWPGLQLSDMESRQLTKRRKGFGLNTIHEAGIVVRILDRLWIGILFGKHLQSNCRVTINLSNPACRGSNPIMVVVAVAGTGLVGKQVIRELLTSNKHTVIVLSRTAKPELSARGAVVEIVEYSSITSIVAALSGHAHPIHTVISCIASFDLAAMLQSQLNLLQAAKAVGAKRFAPSEFGLPRDANRIIKVYAEIKDPVWKAAEESGLEITAFTCGLFMNYLAHGSSSSRAQQELEDSDWSLPFVVDIKEGKADIPGTGDELITLTRWQDVGKFVAAAVDLEKWEKDSSMAGEVTTYNEVVKIAEEVTGRKFEIVKHSVEDLRRELQGKTNVQERSFVEANLVRALGSAWAEPRLNKVVDVIPMSLKDFLLVCWGS